MSTLAQYHGTCTECGETIIPGQRIQPGDDGDGWAHQDCHARPEEAPCACQRCFLIHAPSQASCQ